MIYEFVSDALQVSGKVSRRRDIDSNSADEQFTRRID
jgi:hypothetical protein